MIVNLPIYGQKDRHLRGLPYIHTHKNAIINAMCVSVTRVTSEKNYDDDDVKSAGEYL